MRESLNVDWIEKQSASSSCKLHIQATECAVFSGSSRQSSRQSSRDEALKNRLNLYKACPLLRQRSV